MPALAVIDDRAAARLRQGHVWIYRGGLLGFEGPAARPGEPVWVRDRQGRTLGTADYSVASQIALRLLDRRAVEFDSAFWRDRLREVLAYRRSVVSDTDAYRLIWAEADRLPGLIVDRYGPALVIQTLTQAMAGRQAELIDLLIELLSLETPLEIIVERNDVPIRRHEALPLERRLARGATACVDVTIGRLHWGVDLLAGQKTGAYLDQRENWAAAARSAVPGGEALDVFTYHGGFALSLARAGMRVEGVDLSRPALEQAEANAQRNGLGAANWIEANAFDLLREYDATGRSFDLIVLDPPAFAPNRRSLAAAERGYKEINLRALRLLRPNGILITCCCSHHVSEPLFETIVAAAAGDARREMTLLERRTQALDHPILLSVPETSYLKCAIFRAR